MADNTIANAIKFLKGEEKSLPATKTEGQVYFAYKNVGTAEKPSYTGAIYIDTPIRGTQTRVKMTANADVADKAFNDSAGLNIRETYLSSLGYTDDGKQTILIKGSGNNQTRIALPIASTTKSGIVTTDTQSFGGTKTFVTINSTNLTITGSDGFNYSSIGSGTADAVRPVWFADNSGNGKPVVNTNFTYNPATQTLSVANLSGTADKANKDNAGYDIRSTYISNITVNGTTLTFTKGSGATSSITLQDNNNAVTQTAIKSSDYTNWRTVLWGASNSGVEGFTPTTVTDGAFTSETLTFQPSSGTLRAKIFKGSLSGNASTATTASKAINDGSNQNIANTYVKYKSIKFNATADKVYLLEGNGAGSVTATSGSNISTAIIPAATDKAAGVITTGTQTFSGEKIFNNNVYIRQALIGNNLVDGCDSSKFIIIPKVPYSIIDSTHNTDTYFKALLKWICQKYPNMIDYTFVGLANPNVNGKVSIHIYNTSDVKDGYPQYSAGFFHSLFGTFIAFGTAEYNFYYRESLMTDNNYAGSASPGGAATSANKLNTNAGSAILPVYFSNGVPVACSTNLGVSITGNAASATKLTSSAGSVTQPIYFKDGKPVATTYSLNATVKAGVSSRIAYYSGNNEISSASSLKYYTAINNKKAAQTVLRIWGATCGNDATNTISGKASSLSWNDGGPQIQFSISETGAQGGALIFTDNDSAGIGASFHFVSSESDWSVVSKRFVAKTSVIIGQESHTVSNQGYNLYVNGTEYIKGVLTAVGDCAFIAHGNEFNFVPTLKASSSVWFNYRQTGGQPTADNFIINEYIFGNGANKALASIKDGLFSGAATYIRDSNNNTNNISITCSKAGQASTSWLASWNGYELGAISPNNITAGKATLLATARKISLTGDAVGSATFNGGADISISTVTRQTCFVGSDSASSSGWYKVASQTMSGYGDSNIMFAVTSTYSNYYTGIFSLQIRSDNTSIQCPKAEWLVRSGFSADSIKIVISKMTWTMYVNRSVSQYGRIMFEVLTQSSINGKSSGLTMYNTYTKESVTPNATKTSSDGGTVNYANSTYNSTMWNNYENDIGTNNTTDTWLLVANNRKIQHRLSTSFATSGHTHNYAGSASVGGPANSAIKLNSLGTIKAETGTTSQSTSGLSMQQAYNNGYPVSFGNVLNLNGQGQGQILVSWAENGSTPASKMYFRGKTNNNAGDWSSWNEVINSSNIGSQSVNYANSAGSVAWGNVTGKPSSFTPSSHTHPYLPLDGGTMTGTINFNADKLACNFRSGNNSFHSGIMHQSAGEEALVFAVARTSTSFIFKCGQDPVGMTSSTWKNITPSMQIRNQSVYINSLIVTPSYNLYVNGTTRCNGTLGVGNGSSAEIDFFPNSSSIIGARIKAYSDRIEFIFS